MIFWSTLQTHSHRQNSRLGLVVTCTVLQIQQAHVVLVIIASKQLTQCFQIQHLKTYGRPSRLSPPGAGKPIQLTHTHTHTHTNVCVCVCVCVVACMRAFCLHLVLLNYLYYYNILRLVRASAQHWPLNTQPFNLHSIFTVIINCCWGSATRVEASLRTVEAHQVPIDRHQRTNQLTDIR